MIISRNRASAAGAVMELNLNHLLCFLSCISGICLLKKSLHVGLVPSSWVQCGCYSSSITPSQENRALASSTAQTTKPLKWISLALKGLALDNYLSETITLARARLKECFPDNLPCWRGEGCVTTPGSTWATKGGEIKAQSGPVNKNRDSSQIGERQLALHDVWSKALTVYTY